jgi:type IV secretory pathway VirB4 component
MIENAYRKSGIYLDDKASWRRTPPTFTAIFEALSQFASENTSKADSWKKTTAEALLSQITPLVSGDMRYLNQQTTVSLEGKNIVCFDVSSTPAYNPIQRALSLFVVFDFIHSRVCRQNDKRRRMIIVDEAWSVFENNQDYLGPIVRTGRKDNISVVMIDQNVEDLLTMDAQGRPRDR